MKTLDQIFEERRLVKGTDFYDAAMEYGEQYRRLAKDSAFELGNSLKIIMLLEEQIKDLKARKPFIRDVTFDPDPNDGKNSSHEHSYGKGGWSV